MIDLSEADRILRKLSASKYTICPQLKNTFKAFRLCSPDNLRVVIIGQDPYNNLLSINQNGILTKVPVATGIAFANPADTPDKQLSPSLKVLKESVIDYTIPHGIITFDPSLEKWEEQGVLMLNSALTCKALQPGSHSLLWRAFISSFLRHLSINLPGTVYLLMGKMAQSMEPYICKQNHIIHIRHPAYYARTGEKMPHELWTYVNSILKGQSGSIINWYNEQ